MQFLIAEIGEKGALHQKIPRRLHAQICYRSSLLSLSLSLYSPLFIYFFSHFFHTRTHGKYIAIRFCLGGLSRIPGSEVANLKSYG